MEANFKTMQNNNGKPLPENEDGFNELAHQKMALKLINGLISEIFDPNLFYSRLSFLESDKDAINKKMSNCKANA